MERQKLNSGFRWVFYLILIGIVVSLSSGSVPFLECWKDKVVSKNVSICLEKRKKKVSGIIIDTYFEKGEFLMVIDQRRDTLKYIDFSGSGLENMLSIGDSLVKNNNSFDIYIYKRENSSPIYLNIDSVYNCDVWKY